MLSTKIGCSCLSGVCFCPEPEVYVSDHEIKSHWPIVKATFGDKK